MKRFVSFHLTSFQKQPSRGVLKKRCSENIQQIYRRRPMPKCDFNKVALQLYCNSALAWTWMLSCKFAAYFQNTFSYEPMDDSFCSFKIRNTNVIFNQTLKYKKMSLISKWNITKWKMYQMLITNNGLQVSLQNGKTMIISKKIVYSAFFLKASWWQLRNWVKTWTSAFWGMNREKVSNAIWHLLQLILIWVRNT